jgi:membrane protein involved in colicin uptake
MKLPHPPALRTSRSGTMRGERARTAMAFEGFTQGAWRIRRAFLTVLLLVCGTAGAQTADDYFNGGARSYISNNVADAKKVVEGGLKLYPNDVKLQKLEELLKQQSQSQSQSSQNQQQQQQQNQQQKPDEQKQQDQQKQDQSQDQNQQDKDKDKEKQQQDQQKPPEQNQADNDAKEKADEAKREAEMMAAGEMTPKQADQLLDKQKEDEQVLRLAPPNKNTLQSRPYRNW